MSRIDEARRRAEAGEAVSLARTPAGAGDAFHSPWRFPAGTAEAEPGGLPAEAAGSPLAEPTTELLPGSGFSSQWKERLVVAPEADAILVEQFRRLAATLHQAQTINNIRTVMVTSASPSDGKTLTAINLALILSESYRRRVLLVDADLRRPSIRDVSHMPNVIGLSDGLRAKTEQKLTVLQITKTLTLLPAGRPDPDPMSGLTSARMRRILEDAGSRFDWVVVDAPPVGTVADASLLVDMVDAVLLVVRAGHTQCGLVKRAIDAVGADKILGVVLNAVEELDKTEYATYHGAYGPPGAVGG